MKPARPPSARDANKKIAALIETLHQTGQRLEELTAGEVDAVADRDGRTFLLRHAQEQLRHSEAAKQAAILNALPAHIALLDSQGRIISVNEAWRRFADANALQGPGYGIGVNYLAICDNAQGDGAAESHQAATGIRSVLAGTANSFSIEYPCHSPTEQRWFLMTVTPLADDHQHGVVVMHLNITERKEAQDQIVQLSRIYAVLSGINSLIVRVRDRAELFKEACRVAVEAGGFRMSLICVVDQDTLQIVPVASAGKDERLMTAIKGILSSEDAPKTMVARAVREKKAIVSNELKNDSKVLFNKKYTESGVCSMAIFPLMVSDEAVGVLALYASESEFFQEEELKLLAELAGDIAFAIDHIDKQERLDYLAYYDAVTGLANRTLFLERVAQHLRSAASSGNKVAVALFDLERFKNINDSLGRKAGDDLLRQVAEWLMHRSGGDASLLARVGADHFAIVWPGIDRLYDITKRIAKGTKAFQEHPFRMDGAVFRIAFKVGVTLFPDDGADAETLLRNAEAALKKAKASGEHYLFYTQNMTATVAAKLTLETQLRQALDNEEFILHYQPKVNLVSGKLTSAEALIRWNNPRTGLVPPGHFIPILEETGLIYDVGRWALRRAIEDYLRWRNAGLTAVRIAVNVSPLQLRNPGFVAEIKQIIGVDAHAAAGLELEITESVIMEGVDANIASLRAIRALGVTIAIDDFGTGFSSLNYLSKLPVDTLKIDRSFVIDMTARPEGLSLVSTIINLAHALKLKVVAEGVETEEQARLLRVVNCDEMQGYLFSKPVPVDIFETKFLTRLPPDEE